MHISKDFHRRFHSIYQHTFRCYCSNFTYKHCSPSIKFRMSKRKLEKRGTKKEKFHPPTKLIIYVKQTDKVSEFSLVSKSKHSPHSMQTTNGTFISNTIAILIIRSSFFCCCLLC